jgi:1-deoxy-D-xylulose-5-phosphate synthase
VIGDGAMTAGMAFEAMNNAGVPHAGMSANLLVVLNDNDMSISPPVGALNKYLARLMSGRFYTAAREGAKSMLKNAPPLFELARRFEEHAKGMVVPGTIFEEFGFNYVGPIDGHDLDALIPTLENLRDKHGPQFLHVVTKKGYGYKLAEADPVNYHGPGKFDPEVGLTKPATPPKPTYTQVFGQWLCDMAAADDKLVGITPAMREGSGMVEFHQRFPRRYYDVGIAEQHAVTFAAGLACEGLKPVLAIYSTFLQRGYDQLIHDVAIQNLPVVFALDRAGIVGADGATHCGAFDIAYIRCVPNLSLLVPADEDECRTALTTAYRQNHPVAVRYPRGTGTGAPVQAGFAQWEWGKGEVRRESTLPRTAAGRIAILAFGPLLYAALDVAGRLNATVANMRYAKPLDAELVRQLAQSHDAIVTLEEGCISGGAGAAVMETLQAAALKTPVLALGLPDQFVEHGDPARLLAAIGLDAAGIEQSIIKRFGARLSAVAPAVAVNG